LVFVSATIKNHARPKRATGLLIDTIRNKRDVESEGFYPQLIVRDSTCPALSKR
jgi:LacI family transcriptional regulator